MVFKQKVIFLHETPQFMLTNECLGKLMLKKSTHGYILGSQCSLDLSNIQSVWLLSRSVFMIMVSYLCPKNNLDNNITCFQSYYPRINLEINFLTVISENRFISVNNITYLLCCSITIP